MAGGDGTALDRARAAAASGAWSDAYARFREVDPSILTAHDLEALADAAWWSGDLDACVSYRQKAYAAYAAAGEDYPAAGMAARLAIEFFQRGQPTVGNGWLGRARRHAAEVPESAGHGYLSVIEATVERYMGDPGEALDRARYGVELGRRYGDRDLLAMAIHTEGLILVALGRIPEGIALLDDAMTSVLAGELTPFFTGIVYCNVIATCLELGDLGRAGEWAEASRTWCETLPPESPFPGQCRTNLAVVARLSGDWIEAEDEAVLAGEQLVRLGHPDAGYAFYQLGEVRRQRGDGAAAEQAYERASELGVDPVPGLALLRLAQGKPRDAVAILRHGRTGGAPPDRARLLAAGVEIALAASDLREARERAAELEELAAAFAAPAVEAAAASARGAVQLADGSPAAALGSLRAALTLWQDMRVPYEAARTRALIGRALVASGDEEGGGLEFRAALAGFEGLGATPDVDSVLALLGSPATLPRGLTHREADVLRLVASGKTNRDIAVELVISEHTVGRHLQNIYAKLDVSSRSAATAFAFEHGLK